MKLKQKKLLSGEHIESVSFSNKSIRIQLKNGSKFTCKPIGSMNLASWIDYSEDVENLL